MDQNDIVYSEQVENIAGSWVLIRGEEAQALIDIFSKASIQLFDYSENKARVILRFSGKFEGSISGVVAARRRRSALDEQTLKVLWDKFTHEYNINYVSFSAGSRKHQSMMMDVEIEISEDSILVRNLNKAAVKN